MYLRNPGWDSVVPMMAAGMSALMYFRSLGQGMFTGGIAEGDVAHGYEETYPKISEVELAFLGSHSDEWSVG